MQRVKRLKDFFIQRLQRLQSWVSTMVEEQDNSDMEEKENDDEEKSGKKQKIQFPQYFQQQNQSGSNQHGTNLKTPVLRGVVVSEFDGDRIWVEASGNMKGRYGVEIPNGYDPEDFTPGTEVALDPNSFTVTDIVEKGKDAEFDAIQTDITFQDVGGLDHIIKSLKSNVGAQLDPEKQQKIQEWGMDLDKSILLIGKPGTGKTHLVNSATSTTPICS